ncbi:MAG: methionine gamma-lyase family protein, partial [Butyricicoccus pullicaecorum]|nr:methionine gamma-lyase family protein [Butyricicoccus pullicaecorum]
MKKENFLGLSERVIELGKQAEQYLTPYFARIDEIADYNTQKVLAAFRAHRVSDTMFAGTTGYGYDDHGRDTLEEIYADLFGTEAGLVRLGFVNGTHALSCALFGALEPGDVMLSVTSAPYDTLLNTVTGDCPGSMKRYGIGYRQVDLKDGRLDLEAIEKAAAADDVKMVFLQRSRGYAVRQTLSCAEIGEACAVVRRVNPNAVIMVDNCYGEFTEELEPTQVGADMCAGSLI